MRHPSPHTSRRRDQRLVRAGLIFVSTCAALAAGASPAAAADNGSWAVEPTGVSGASGRSFFSFDLSPGQAIDDSVSIANLTDEPLTFALASADALTTEDGTFALDPDYEAADDIGSWIDLSVDRWTVAGGQQADIPFQLRVPPDAAPGDHAGGIVAVNTEAEDTVRAGALSIDVQRAVGARVFVNVDGPTRTDLQVEQLEDSHDVPALPVIGDASATISWRITNAGNVRLSPSGRFEVEGPLGGDIVDRDLGVLGDLLPGSSIVVTESWSGVPFVGPVTQRLTVTTDEIEIVRTSSFVAFPWATLVLLAGLIAVAVGGFVLLRSRRSRSEGAPKSVVET